MTPSGAGRRHIFLLVADVSRAALIYISAAITDVSGGISRADIVNFASRGQAAAPNWPAQISVWTARYYSRRLPLLHSPAHATNRLRPRITLRQEADFSIPGRYKYYSLHAMAHARHHGYG